jgi:hypothetical protein
VLHGSIAVHNCKTDKGLVRSRSPVLRQWYLRDKDQSHMYPNHVQSGNASRLAKQVDGYEMWSRCSYVEPNHLRGLPMLSTRTTAPAKTPACNNSLRHSYQLRKPELRVAHLRLRLVTDNLCAIHLEPQQCPNYQHEYECRPKLRAPLGTHKVMYTLASGMRYGLRCLHIGIRMSSS